MPDEKWHIKPDYFDQQNAFSLYREECKQYLGDLLSKNDKDLMEKEYLDINDLNFPPETTTDDLDVGKILTFLKAQDEVLSITSPQMF